MKQSYCCLFCSKSTRKGLDNSSMVSAEKDIAICDTIQRLTDTWALNGSKLNLTDVI